MIAGGGVTVCATSWASAGVGLAPTVQCAVVPPSIGDGEPCASAAKPSVAAPTVTSTIAVTWFVPSVA